MAARPDEAAALGEPKIQKATGLTGRTVLLPSDDAALYEQHLQEFAGEFQSVAPRENVLVQALADNSWRLQRIPALEMALDASGHEQFAEQFADRDPALRCSLIQMHTFLHYEKQLRNLPIQESRLRRHREKDLAELRQLLSTPLPKVSLLTTMGSISNGRCGYPLAAVQDFIKARQASLEERQFPACAAIAA